MIFQRAERGGGLLLLSKYNYKEKKEVKTSDDKKTRRGENET